MTKEVVSGVRNPPDSAQEPLASTTSPKKGFTVVTPVSLQPPDEPSLFVNPGRFALSDIAIHRNGGAIATLANHIALEVPRYRATDGVTPFRYGFHEHSPNGMCDESGDISKLHQKSTNQLNNAISIESAFGSHSNRNFGPSYDLNEDEWQYILCCEKFLNNSTEVTLKQLESVMVTGSVSAPTVQVLEQGMNMCARLLWSSSTTVQITVRRVILKHWLILPEYVRTAYPEIFAGCFDDFIHTLQSPDNFQLEPVINLWSSLVQQNSLNSEQRFSLFVVAVKLAIGLPDTTLKSSLIEFSIAIFSHAESDEETLKLVTEVVLYFQHNESSQSVAHLIVQFIASSVHSKLVGFFDSQASKNTKYFGSSAAKAFWSSTVLSQCISRLLLDVILKASLGTQVHLFVDLLEAILKLLWNDRLASAEILLCSLTKELSSRCSHISPNDARCELLANLMMRYVQTSFEYLQGPWKRCSAKRVILNSNSFHQTLCLVAHQCAHKETSDKEIWEFAALRLAGGPTQEYLSSREWRGFIRQTELLKAMAELENIIEILATGYGFNDCTQVFALKALIPLVRANPESYAVSALTLLDRLTFSSSHVCEALIQMADAAFIPAAPSSFALVKRVGVRLITASLKQFKMVVAKFLGRGIESNDEVRNLCFVLLLAIMEDAGSSIIGYASAIAAEFLFPDKEVVDPATPSAREISLLNAVHQSNITVKLGLRNLVTMLSGLQVSRLEAWSLKLFQYGNDNLACLLTQFGGIIIDRDRICAMIRGLPRAGESLPLLRMTYLASTLSLTNTGASIDPITSHKLFWKLYEMLLLSTKCDSPQVESLSLSLHCMVSLCHPYIREYRVRLLQDLIYASIEELKRFVFGDGHAKEDGVNAGIRSGRGSLRHQTFKETIDREQCISLDANDSERLTHMVMICGCVRHWDFVSRSTSTQIVQMLYSMYVKSIRGSPQSRLLVSTLFSILDRLRMGVENDNNISACLESIMRSEAELDSLITALTNRTWYDSNFENGLLESGQLGSQAMEHIVHRMLETGAAFRSSIVSSALRRCLQRDKVLLDNCIASIISLCFSHNAVIAQSALFLYSELCPQWRLAKVSAVMKGFQLASTNERYHTAPFSRIWELTTSHCPEVNVIALLDALSSSIQDKSSSQAFVVFLVRGMMLARLKPAHTARLQEGLAMSVTRSNQQINPERSSVGNTKCWLW